MKKKYKFTALFPKLESLSNDEDDAEKVKICHCLDLFSTPVAPKTCSG